MRVVFYKFLRTPKSRQLYPHKTINHNIFKFRRTPVELILKKVAILPLAYNKVTTIENFYFFSKVRSYSNFIEII